MPVVGSGPGSRPSTITGAERSAESVRHRDPVVELLAQGRAHENRSVLGQQCFGDDERERRSQHAVEDARHRGHGVACQQAGNDHVRVDDGGRTTHNLRRAART